MAAEQANGGHRVDVVTLNDKFTNADLNRESGVSYHFCEADLVSSFGFSFGIHRILTRTVAEAEIVHIHDIWMYAGWMACREARKTNTPYIISPHGMLDPRSLTMSRLKKQVTMIAFEKGNIQKASCLHALSSLELKNLRMWGYGGPVSVVGLGLSKDELALSAPTAHEPPGTSERTGKTGETVLFLSRLHPQKGIEVLLEAWRAVRKEFPSWKLEIAGEGEHGYADRLENLTKDSEYGGTVTFHGPVYGAGKWNLLKSSSLFVLPTFSENFGHAVVEALACGLPVITTKGTPWEVLEKRQCGWYINLGVESLVNALKVSMRLPEVVRVEMGRRGRSLVESEFTGLRLAQEMTSVYRWIVGGGNPPSCIAL